MALPSDLDLLSVTVQAARTNGRFRRMALISHRRHLAALGPADPDLLVFSTDWMAWRLALNAGFAAIHAEGMLEDWPAERGDPAQIHRRVCEWVYVNGRDESVFHGVSLGKLFVRDVALAVHAYERLRIALDRACRRFAPKELLFIDIRAEFDLLDAPLKDALVDQCAAGAGIPAIRRLDPIAAGDAGLPERIDGYGAPIPEPRLRQILRAALAESLDWLFRFRRLGLDRRAKVLLLSNWATMRGLIDAAPDGGVVAPALIMSLMPKRPAMLWNWLRRGFTLVGSPAVRLNQSDRADLARIKQIYEAALPADDAVGMFVRRRILHSSWLESQAIEVKRWGALFRRHRFSRVLIGDATNGLCRLLAETAQVHGVKVDELLNGMFLTRQRYDVRCGDSHGGAKVDRLLAWGRAYEIWNSLTEAKTQCVRVGYPALDPLRRPPAPRAEKLRRALVLPVYADCDDTPALFAHIFTYLVQTVARLNAAGCTEIRVKIHPGPQNISYYQDVLDLFGLQAEVIKLGPLQPHVDWCDAIIGPVNSGAMVECLAMGKPYHAIKPTPSLLDDQLIGPMPTYAVAADAVAAAAAGQAFDFDGVMEYLTSSVTIPQSSQAVWDVWRQDQAKP